MSTVKLMTLIKEWGPIVWDGDVWEDSIESEDFEPSYFQRFISPEEIVSPPSAEGVLPPPSPEILPFSPLTEEIHPSLSAQPAETFSEGHAN